MNNTLQRIWRISTDTDEQGSYQRPCNTQALYQKPCRTMKKRGLGRVFFLCHKTLVLGFIDDFVGTDPRHHGAQLLTDDFDAVSSVVTTLGGHRRVAGCAF